MRTASLFLLLLLSGSAAALLPGSAAAQVTPQQTGTDAEFRAMHAPTGQIVWAAGRGGVYAVTTDGGVSWRADSVPGAGDLFLTGVWAGDARTAHLLGTSFDGGLARIYRTDDGGASWDLQWERTGEGVFFDALRCWDVNRCVAFSDPVAGSFLIIRTENGRDWQDVLRGNIPAPLPGEAGFAASGTALTTFPPQHVWIGTGGAARARIYHSADGGVTWSAYDTPLAAGATAGIFGIAFRDASNGIAAGGDYEKRTDRQTNVLRTRDGGRTWSLLGASLPEGVRYGVAYAPVATKGAHALLAVGPSGAGISYDDGTTWTVLDRGAWNTLAFGPAGEAWIGGPQGRIARLW